MHCISRTCCAKLIDKLFMLGLIYCPCPKTKPRHVFDDKKVHLQLLVYLGTLLNAGSVQKKLVEDGELFTVTESTEIVVGFLLTVG